jgi:hypothetical protein
MFCTFFYTKLGPDRSDEIRLSSLRTTARLTEPMAGQKRTFTHLRPMSALPPKADIR